MNIYIYIFGCVCVSLEKVDRDVKKKQKKKNDAWIMYERRVFMEVSSSTSIFHDTAIENSWDGRMERKMMMSMYVVSRARRASSWKLMMSS